MTRGELASGGVVFHFGVKGAVGPVQPIHEEHEFWSRLHVSTKRRFSIFIVLHCVVKGIWYFSRCTDRPEENWYW
jgi:hypothetical protein